MMPGATAVPEDDPPARPREPPTPPELPGPADCCGGGCLHCVYDIYDQAMKRYQAALAEWESK